MSTAIIMAGGKGRRLGGYLPKCLFPLPTRQTLLTRVLEQLMETGIARALVCCSSENFETIRSFINLYQAQSQTPQQIETIECECCEQGPLPALAEMLGKVETDSALVCLADIFFFVNPFSALPLDLAPESSVLISGQTSDRGLEGGTGWLTCNEREIESVSYRPPESAEPKSLRRWSGSVLLGKAWRTDLSNRFLQFSARPFEDWISDCMSRGYSCEESNGGRFVNVNSFAEYRALVNGEQGQSTMR